MNRANFILLTLIILCVLIVMIMQCKDEKSIPEKLTKIVTFNIDEGHLLKFSYTSKTDTLLKVEYDFKLIGIVDKNYEFSFYENHSPITVSVNSVKQTVLVLSFKVPSHQPIVVTMTKNYCYIFKPKEELKRDKVHYEYQINQL